ncbi:MAG: LysR family transcriptional regulator, partial [Actinomycetota bacterium]
MDIRQLSALLAVADHGTFSAAARALHTVQSNVSTHVAHLERDLGVTLIDRTRGEPTEAGQAVVNRARRILNELTAIESDIASLGAEVSGTVRLGVIGTIGRLLTPIIFERMAEGHPQVRVVVIDATTTSLVPQVVRAELDLALVNLPAGDPDVTTSVLFEEDRVLVTPAEHPLADRTTAGLDDLAEHDLLLEPVGTGFRDELDAAAASAGVELRVRAEVDGMRLLTSLAIGGYGAAVLPVSAVPLDPTGSWRRIPLDGIPPREVGLCWERRTQLSAPATVLAELIGQVVAETAPGLDGL